MAFQSAGAMRGDEAILSLQPKRSGVPSSKLFRVGSEFVMASSRRPPPLGWDNPTPEYVVLASADLDGQAAREVGWLLSEIKTIYGQVLTEPLPPEMARLLMMLSDRRHD